MNVRDAENRSIIKVNTIVAGIIIMMWKLIIKIVLDN